MKAKVCLVGEGAVGKTCLIRRFIHEQFDDKYISTLGAKVSKKEINVAGPNPGDNLKMDMTIWDIMGEKGFRELLKEAYFHGAQGILAVCDVTRRATLADLSEWIEAVNRVTGNIPVVYLGNKSDLTENVQVTEEELRKFATSQKAPWLYTSAKTGLNVEKAFGELGRLVSSREISRQVA